MAPVFLEVLMNNPLENRWCHTSTWAARSWREVIDTTEFIIYNNKWVFQLHYYYEVTPKPNKNVLTPVRRPFPDSL